MWKNFMSLVSFFSVLKNRTNISHFLNVFKNHIKNTVKILNVLNVFSLFLTNYVARSFFVCFFILVLNFNTKNLSSKKGFSSKRGSLKDTVKRRYTELSKKFCGEMYMIENEHGVFIVGVQQHLKYSATGKASYYSSGTITATGEYFYTYSRYTAAHPYLPLPCVVEVVCLDNPRKRLIVKVNDRGPFVKNSDVIIDLSVRCARELGFLHHGLIKVRVTCLQKETMMLVENGGDVEWLGDVPFSVAVRRAENKKRRQKKTSSRNK